MLILSWEGREEQCIKSRVVEKIVSPNILDNRLEILSNCQIKNNSQNQVKFSPYFQDKTKEINSRIQQIESALYNKDGSNHLAPLKVIIEKDNEKEPLDLKAEAMLEVGAGADQVSIQNETKNSDIRLTEKELFLTHVLEKQLIVYWLKNKLSEFPISNKMEENIILAIMEGALHLYFGFDREPTFDIFFKNKEARQYWNFVYAWFESYKELSIAEKSRFIKSAINLIANKQSGLKSFSQFFYLPFDERKKMDRFLISYKKILRAQPIVFADVEMAKKSPLKSIGVSSIILETCSPISLDGLRELGHNYTRLLLIKKCDTKEVDYYSYRNGMKAFAKANKDTHFIEIHIPSLNLKKFAAESTNQIFNNIDLMSIVGSKQLASQYFGWTDVVPSAEGNYFQPKSTIDAIVSFRL